MYNFYDSYLILFSTTFHSLTTYSFELMLNEKEPLTRDKFREKLLYASQTETILEMQTTEIDFLFDLLVFE